MSDRQAHPVGLPFIVGNEAAERFSYYGMKSILVVFMTTMLMNANGSPAPMSSSEATFWYHLFGVGNYLFPIVGAIVADVWWGKYRTIMVLSLVYCVGHAILAVDDTRLGLFLGLTVIAIGAGGIKPCVSAHLGDQYRESGNPRISQGYSLFYVAINVGALISTLLIPIILAWYGPRVAFAVPGIVMAFATVVFWCGRNRYTRVPPTPLSRYISELRSPAGRQALARIGALFVFVSVFWALFDQSGSSWVLQAERMNRTLELPLVGSVTVLPAQVQAINPFLIIVLTPLFSWRVYPFFERRGLLSTRAKIGCGMVLAGCSFMLVALAQHWILQGQDVSILWQCAAFLVLTVAEVMVSVTTLEVAYTHAPRASTSLVTAFYLLSVSLGNGIAALYNGYLTGLCGGPESVSYFMFFAAVVFVASLGVKRVVAGVPGLTPFDR